MKVFKQANMLRMLSHSEGLKTLSLSSLSSHPTISLVSSTHTFNKYVFSPLTQIPTPPFSLKASPSNICVR